MKRRWFIRSLALLLVTACSMAWGWSFHSIFSIEYGTTTSDNSLDSLRGQLFISRWSNSGLSNQLLGWIIDTGNSDEKYGESFDGELDSTLLVGRFLGFAFWGKADGSADHFIGIVIPYWFIDSAAVLITLYAWMKTRPAPNPARAFPVDIKTIQQEITEETEK